MIKEVKYAGHTAQPSDYECPDGELDVSMNLVPEDGALRPIYEPKTIMQLSSNENVVFVHVTNAYTHYIIYDGTNVAAVSKDDTATRLLFHKEKETSSEHEDMTAITGATGFSSVGNVLIVRTSTAVHYFLWKTDDPCYLYLGTHLPELRVQCGLSYDIVRTGKTGKYFYGDPEYFYKNDDDDDESDDDDTADKDDTEESKGFYVDIKHAISDITDDWSTSELSADEYRTDEEWITSTVLAKVNKFIQEQSVDKGRFIFPFLVRVAYRLYDGSLVMHTAPMLMIPSDACTPMALCSKLHIDSGKLTDFHCIMTAATAKLRLAFDSYSEMKNWKDIITSLDVFVSKPIYTYDQNGHCYRLKQLKDYNPNVIGAYKGTALSDRQQPFWQAYYNKFKSSLNAESRTVTGTTVAGASSSYSNFINSCYCVEVPHRSADEITDDIKDNASFYLLHSYKVDELDKDLGIVPVDSDYLQSLVNREVMTDDYDSHDTILPSTMLSYNSRLNMGDVRKRLFDGFPPYMLAQYQHDTSSKTVVKRTAYIYIRMDDGVHVVKSTDTASYSNGEIVYIFYPNARAFKAIIEDNGTYREYVLETHAFLSNAAIYYAGFHSKGKTLAALPSDCVPDDDPVVDMGNKVYTSDVNNPFHFAVGNIYTVGTGRVLGISTAAKALSEGQFGQFPLYAFTTEGVWALEVSTTTGAFSARQPITRDVCTNADSITQLDNAVLFTTDRGIMLISGSETVCLSDTINREVPFSLDDLPVVTALMNKTAFTLRQLGFYPFMDFLSGNEQIGGCGMLYDYTHQRIIVYNHGCEYAYVYSLKDKAWGMMGSCILHALATYPEALAMTTDNRLVDFSQDDETSKAKGVDYLVITRPMKLDAPDQLKTVDTVLQRGHFLKTHTAQVIYGSRDLMSWHYVWSSVDKYMRGFRGTPYKYFRLVVLGTLSKGESVYGATIQHTLRLTNQPR